MHLLSSASWAEGGDFRALQPFAVLSLHTNQHQVKIQCQLKAKVKTVKQKMCQYSQISEVSL